MKDYTYYFLALFFLLQGCNKQPQTPYDAVKDKNAGFITATINGKPWNSNFAYSAIQGDNKYQCRGKLYLNDNPRQELNLGNVKPFIGSEQTLYSHLDGTGHSIPNVHDSSYIYFALSNGDVGEGFYHVLEGSDSHFTIESYDAKSLRMTGHFNAVLVTNFPPTKGFADTLKVTNGYFDVRALANDE